MGDAAGGGGSSGRPRHGTSIVRCDSGEWSALVQSTTDAVGDGSVASRRREALLPPKVEYLQPQPKAHEMASKAQSYADRVKVEDSPRPLDVLLQPKAAKTEPANPNHHLHSVDDLFSFAGFSTMLEALPDKPQAERAKLVQGFWKVVDAALEQRLKSDDVKTADAAAMHRADYHPFLRLLLPHLDGRRSTYGLKESKIAQCYAKILRIPAESADAQRLTKWKDPSKSSAAATSFSDVLYTVLIKRGFREVVRKEGVPAPTIRDVNELLDELSQADTPARKNAVLTRVVRGFNALEQKWLTRVITKDMKLGVSHATVLARLHPSAMQVLNTTTDLVHVCRVCAFAEAVSDADAEGGGGGARGGAGAELALNQAFNPMLAALVTQDRLASALASGPYWVEPKYDGERILIHFSVVSGAGGGQREYSVKFLTRNSKDYTTLYGPKFSRVVIDALKGQVREDCILDGELLVYDAAAGTFKQFGANKTFALDFASGGQGGQQQGGSDTFCYMAFDVVFLNGAPLTAVPLAQRREALLKLVRPTRNQIEVVPLLSQRVAGVREVLAALDEAVCTASYEGIILKLTTSLYTPGERKLRWLKLKRDHVEGLADTLDLVVVGAYHGTKFGRKGLSHFLLAVYKRSSDDDEGGGEGRWETFTKVGTGYDRQELDVINRSLEGKLLPYTPGGAAAGNIHSDPLYHPDSRSAADVVLLRKKLFGAWRPAADDVPDVFLHPACVQRSVVLEVIGYAFTETIKFAVGKTVRFPRVRRLRTDKTPADATDYEQLVRIMEAGAEGRRLAVDLHSSRPSQGEGGGGGAGGGAQPRARRRRLLGGAGASADGEAPANYVQRQRLMLLGSYVGGGEAPSGEGGGGEGSTGGGEGGDVDERLRTRSTALCVRGEPLALCVLQCEQTEGWSKELLQTLIRHHGGAAPANPTKDCFLVASSASAAKVKHWRDAVERGDSAVQGYRNKYVLHHSWVVDSIKARRPLPCAPRYMVYTSPDLRERFSKTIDAHGDTYFLPATLASLRQILTDAFPPPPPPPSPAPASPAGAQAGKRRRAGRAETEAAEAAASLARFAALSAASLRALRARRALGLPAAPSPPPPPPSRGRGLCATAFAGHVVAYAEASLLLGDCGVEDAEGEQAEGGGGSGSGSMRLALLEAAHRGALVVRAEDVVGGGDDAACRMEEDGDRDGACSPPCMTLLVSGTEPRSEMAALAARCAADLSGGAGRVSVVRCAWILDSVAAGALLPEASYAVGVPDASPAATTAAVAAAAAEPPPAAKRRRVDEGELRGAAATPAPAQNTSARGSGAGALSTHGSAVLSTRRPVGDGVSFGAVPDLSCSVDRGFDGDEDEEDDACGKPSAFMISHLQSLGPSVAAAAAAAAEAPEEMGVAGMLMESDGPLATGDTQF